MIENNANKTARVFFALWPDDAERAAMTAWQSPLQQVCGGRAMAAEKLHNTLVFLGDVQLERLEALQLAAQEVSTERFHVVFDTAKYWGRNHIVYASPREIPPKLSTLVSSLEKILLCHHFKFDQRGYKPHITLLRHAKWNDNPLPEMPSVVWGKQDFALVHSVSGEQGVGYEVLARFPLTFGKQR